MKRMYRQWVSLLLILTLCVPLTVFGESRIAPENGLRGVWVASVFNIDYPSKPTTDSEQLKAEAIAILDNTQKMGLNAVFLQVRPTGDALYPSNYYPWSKYLTGTQGVAPSNGFDPLKFWVEEAHKRNIELHAWVNPYRITKKSSSEPAPTFAAMPDNNPAKQHQNWVVQYTDKNLYFDPGLPEVRQLIIDSSLELAKNYQIDGIHFDDYFYPGADFNDTASFSKYGKGYKTRDDWRRDNVTALIRGMSTALRSANPHVRFGVSPFGIWANKKTNALGSDTAGQQSFYNHYADTLKWVKEGSVDYIAPQLYWNIGYTIADYSKLYTWWKNAVAGTGVELYIGHGAYRTGNTDASSPWYGIQEMARQLDYNQKNGGSSGSIFYNYSALVGKPELSTLLKNRFGGAVSAAPAVTTAPVSSAATTPSTAGTTSGVVTPSTPVTTPVSTVPAQGLTVARPAGNLATSLTSYYFTGTSDPSLPLTVNGTPVTARSASGYYGVLVPLKSGKNVISVTQGATTIQRTLTLGGGSTSSGTTTAVAADIPATSTFPQSSEYQQVGATVTLSCKAPVGAKVTVTVNSQVLAMTPASTQAAGSKVVLTTYTSPYILQNPSSNLSIVDFGNPVYTMTYKGVTKTAKAPGNLGAIPYGAPFFARVSKEIANTYTAPTTSNGAANELYQGMVSRVVAMSGTYVKLDSGLYMAKAAVETYSNPSQTLIVTNQDYTLQDKWESFNLGMNIPSAATASYEGTSLKFNVPMLQSAPIPTLPKDSIFGSVTAQNTGLSTVYTFTLKSGQTLQGFTVEKTATGIALKAKRPIHLADGNLAGLTVLIDPGHGGSDTGAIGPMGAAYAEKTINLNTALKLRDSLQRAGATVLMTRTTDTDVTLDQRLSASRSAKPDMFISVHSNAMGENVDCSKVFGFSTYYRDGFTSALSQSVQTSIIQQLQRVDKGSRNSNYYVTRGTWTPSILVETGFVPNPYEFEWLSSDSGQTQLADGIVSGISKFFR